MDEWVVKIGLARFYWTALKILIPGVCIGTFVWFVLFQLGLVHDLPPGLRR